MPKGIIYKYTSPSGKSYIGQTVNSLERRARSNGIGYKPCPIFYKAIQKYGFQNFSCEVLKNIEKDRLEELGKELDFWEQYYIKLYNSLSPNGYNVRAGGDSKAIFSDDSLTHLSGSQHPSWRQDLDEEEIVKLYQSGKTLQAIAEELKEPKETIKRHLQEKGLLREKRYNQPVIKLDKQGNIIGRWNSASEAEREEKAGQNTIGRCCRERRRPYKGHTYRFEGDKL